MIINIIIQHVTTNTNLILINKTNDSCVFADAPTINAEIIIDMIISNNLLDVLNAFTSDEIMIDLNDNELFKKIDEFIRVQIEKANR